MVSAQENKLLEIGTLSNTVGTLFYFIFDRQTTLFYFLRMPSKIQTERQGKKRDLLVIQLEIEIDLNHSHPKILDTRLYCVH